MSTKWLAALALLQLVVSACESADTIQKQNAIVETPKSPSYTLPGQRGFDQMTEGDSTGRARFCDEAEATQQVAKMIEEPIIPDVSIGGVPLWGEDGEPMIADDLLGTVTDGKLCDPGAKAANAFAYGPLNEIIIFFDSETRLVEAIQVNTAYRGVLTGKVEHDDVTDEVFIRMRDKVRIGGSGDQGGYELTEYASSARQATRTNSWLNHHNVTLMYGMIRQTFFDGRELPPDYDCVAERRCDVIYASSDEESPQQTHVAFQDSGIEIVFSPEGQVLYVIGSPVRKATFELSGVVSLGDGATLAPILQSGSFDGCLVELGKNTTWADFRSSCIPDDGGRELARANYDVHGQRDAVSVEFDGVTLGFLRKTSEEPIFEDGESPSDNDKLYSLTYTRTFPAASVQFVAADLAVQYVARVQQSLAASLSPDAPPDHPFAALAIPVPPDLSTRPQRIGELEFIGESGEPESYVAWVVQAVQDTYASLPPEQQAMLDPAAVTELALIHPFVGAVMSAFSFGQSDAPEAFTVFRSTDNYRWSVGTSHFLHGGAAYRLTVQYSLYFGAVTSVTIERGTSEVDELFAAVTAASVARGVTDAPYYDARLASTRLTWNPYRLGGDGIVVGEADRRDDMVKVELQNMASGGMLELQVPGVRIEDRAGFLRPLRGERSEFVPAHQVTLAGKETVQLFHVMEDGTIGRVQQNVFKAPMTLCPGLRIGYGDDVRAWVDAWHAAVGDSAYQNCELVFHTSSDGHVLAGVSSIANRIQFETVADQAVNVAVWR
jgi:hypothetical protein